MYLKLLKLEWKSFFRSANLGKGIAVKLLLGFFGLYFLIAFIALGISLYPACKEFFPKEEPILLFNSYLLLWLAFEFVIRFLLQNLPIVDTKPLLIQRVEKKTITHILLLKSLFSFYNLLTPVVAIPFVIVNAMHASYSIFELLAWLIGLIGCALTINFLNFWVQRKFSSNLRALIPLILLLVVLSLLQYYGIFAVTDLFGRFFDLILLYPAVALIPLVLLLISYRLTFGDVKSNFYLDSYLDSKQQTYQTSDLGWTNRFGDLGPFLRLDLKLLWRN